MLRTLARLFRPLPSAFERPAASVADVLAAIRQDRRHPAKPRPEPVPEIPQK